MDKNLNKLITNKIGMTALVGGILALILSTVIFIWSLSFGSGIMVFVGITVSVLLMTVSTLVLCGLKIVKPNEARVFTLFGKYYGTIAEDGFYWVNPFVSDETEKKLNEQLLNGLSGTFNANKNENNEKNEERSKHLPLKEMTLVNGKQKVNDLDGNPIEIGVVVIWKIVDPYKAVFNVNDYRKYLSTQCDGVIRNVARAYPYDISIDNDDEKSLRGSTNEISGILKASLQEKVENAGIEIIEARVAHLSYAVEIANSMLQRQQAKAVVEARTKIVEGAVTMVEMALDELSKREVVELDEERKAQMVSNLLVVLCSNKDTQPVVNSGSLY